MNDRIPVVLTVAIILAGLIIGIAVYAMRVNEALPPQGGDVSLVRPVGPDDHSIGNPEAPVTVIEYSDIDCEYCKDFQEVMEQLMAEYGPGGQVLFVYRHFPIIEVHPDAAFHAEAAECASKEGGDNAFFRFIDALQQAAPGDRTFDPSGYGPLAESIGLSRSAMETCVAGSEFESRVAADFDNGIVIGVNGTPYTLVIAKGQPSIPISGALPYAAMKQIIDQAIAESATTP